MLAVRRANPEAHKAASKKWNDNNPEKVKEMGRRYYEDNKDTHHEYGKKWRADNPEAQRQIQLRYTQKRRSRLKDAFVETVNFDIVWERDKGICCLCGEPADLDDWWLEHKTPLSRGGPHSYDNVGVSHPNCN